MKNKTVLDKKKLNYGFWICLLVMFLATLVMTKVEIGKEYSDFRTHSRWAIGEPLDSKFDKFAFYPIWHVGVRVLYELLPIGREWAAAFVTACFIGLVGALLYRFVEKEMKDKWPMWKCIALTLTLLFVTALYMPWYNTEVYLGQSSPTIWHNPTNLAVKPMTLIVFLCFIKLYQQRETIGNKYLCMVSVIALLSCFTKPSFIQGFLPAVVLFLILELIPNKGKSFGFSLKCALMFLPSGIYFLLSYILMFDSTESRKIGIQPFAVMKMDAPSPLISILLGIAFPLFVLLVLGAKKVFEDKALWLSVLFYFTSMLEFVLLIEETEAVAGNFEWALQLAMFLLFVMTALRFYQTKWKQRWIRVTGNLLFAYHCMSGVYYYLLLLIWSPGQC